MWGSLVKGGSLNVRADAGSATAAEFGGEAYTRGRVFPLFDRWILFVN